MKLHKLVYVNYNLCIHLRQTGVYNRDEDSFQKLLQLSLHDEKSDKRMDGA
jgi:hypothetical protein